MFAKSQTELMGILVDIKRKRTDMQLVTSDPKMVIAKIKGKVIGFDLNNYNATLVIPREGIVKDITFHQGYAEIMMG